MSLFGMNKCKETFSKDTGKPKDDNVNSSMMEYRLESSLRMLRWHAMNMMKILTKMGIRHIQKADNTEGCEMSWIVLCCHGNKKSHCDGHSHLIF
eukprot:scaffold99803_cov127-Cyclotella_meneghiniana.AAC.1